MDTKVIDGIGEKIDAFSVDDTQRRAVRISIILTGLLWFALLGVLGFAPGFQKKEKYKTVRINLQQPVENPVLEKHGVAEPEPAPAPKSLEAPKQPSVASAPNQGAPKASVKPESKPAQAPKQAPKNQTAPAKTPSTQKTDSSYAKAKIKYGKSVDDQLEELNDKMAGKATDFDAAFSDDNSVVNESVAKTTGNKAVSGGNALSGSAATASNSQNSPVQAKQEASSTNKAASTPTKSDLAGIAKITPYADPWLEGTGVSATSKVKTSQNADGKVSMYMTDGTARILLDPLKPVIMISEENAKLIDSARTVTITFKVHAAGDVPMNSVTFTPIAMLPAQVKSEIAEQIAKWRFSSAESDGQAQFEYSIIKR